MPILPVFSDDHALSSGNPSWLVFHVSIFSSAAEALCRPSSTGLENGLSTRIVPEPGLLYMKWKIQLEENTTSHSPEHVGGGFAESDSLNWPVIFGKPEVRAEQRVVQEG